MAMSLPRVQKPTPGAVAGWVAATPAYGVAAAPDPGVVGAGVEPLAEEVKRCCKAVTGQDIAELKKLGVAEVFLPGSSTQDVVRVFRESAASRV